MTARTQARPAPDVGSAWVLPDPPRSGSRAPARRQDPRVRGTPWLLLGLLLAGLTASLALHQLLGSGAPDRTPGPPVFEEARPPGPVADLSSSPLRWARGASDGVGVALVEPRTGSSPPDLEAVTAVLHQRSATATWFVSGRSLARRPGLLDAVRASAGEIGITGFSGRDLATLPDWRVRVELATAQAALAARAQVTASLLLLPASPAVDSFDRAAFATARLAAGQGYGLVLGVPPETAAAGEVAVIVLDANAANSLDALLTRLEPTGLRPQAVSELAGLSQETNAPAGGLARANGQAVLAAARAADIVVTAIGWVFWPVTVLLGVRALLSVVLAVLHARRRPRLGWFGPVTVVVPAYNEVTGIEATLRSLLASRWPGGVRVLVVDDGSTDGTAELVDDLGFPDVEVIRQANAGKAAALNTGIARVHTEVTVLVDGDTVFEPDTIAELVAPFADPRVGATSGNAKVLNRRALLGRWQHIEYVMGFNLDRRLLALCRAIPTVPGAVGAFRMAALRQIGGVSRDTLAEDTDLTIAVTRAGWRVVYQDRARAWTEAPFTTGDLWRQRYRWSYGTLQAVWKHRGAVRERRGIGLVGLPYAWAFQVVLPLLAPIIDVVALYTLLTGGARSVLLAWLGFAATQLILAVVAFRLDHERLRPLWALPLQQLFYRQLMYLVVIQSVLTALSGTRLRWHKLRRAGAAAPVAI